MDAYRVKGIAPMGKARQQFSMDITATDIADAEHRVYSIIGSRHKINRRTIEIKSCDKIDPSESTDPRVVDYFREQLATMKSMPGKETKTKDAPSQEEE